MEERCCEDTGKMECECEHEDSHPQAKGEKDRKHPTPNLKDLNGNHSLASSFQGSQTSGLLLSSEVSSSQFVALE